MRLSGLGPGSTIVEIGPGTGQATRPLAERGLRVLALEIDPRLADRARRNLAAFPDVSVRTTSFEAWDPGTATFDVVFACNSFHWVDPDIRFAKAAMVLNPQGHLVVVSTPVVVPEGASQFWWGGAGRLGRGRSRARRPCDRASRPGGGPRIGGSWRWPLRGARRCAAPLRRHPHGGRARRQPLDAVRCQGAFASRAIRVDRADPTTRRRTRRTPHRPSPRRADRCKATGRYGE
jgi:SAM-dependent methyltransferase